MNICSTIKLAFVLSMLGITSISYATGKTYNIRFENNTPNSYTLSVNSYSHIAHKNIDNLKALNLAPQSTSQYYELHTNGGITADDANLDFTLHCTDANKQPCGTSTYTFSGVIVSHHSYTTSCTSTGSNASWKASSPRTSSSDNATVSLTTK